MTDYVADGRRTFERYAALAARNIGRILSERPVYDGVGVKIGDDLTRFPLAYGITNHGGLRTFVDLMYEMHKNEGITAVLEIVDDVNFGLPQEAATVITLHQAARIGRKIFFTLDGIQEIDDVLADRGRWASTITGLELRYIRDNWAEFRDSISFWRGGVQVRPPWEAAPAALSWINEVAREEMARDFWRGTARTLIRAILLRGLETPEHLTRVAHYSVALAARVVELGCCKGIDSRMDGIGLAAAVHDLGMSGLPDEIIFKNGPLHEAEWNEVRRHPELGERALRPIQESMAAAIASAHHECWDGSGYPLGLVGEAIPLAARIVSIADVYDSLRSERPYRRQYSHSDALALIDQARGAQFDPVIHDVFLSLAARFDEMRTQELVPPWMDG